MKNLNTHLLAFFTLLFCSSLHLYAQPNCASHTAQIEFQTNDIRVNLPGTGGLWWDGSNSRYLMADPNNAGQEVGVLFAGGIWLGGLDPGHNLKLSASTYGHFSGNDAFWPGPLTNMEGVTESQTCANYDRFWRVEQADIQSLLDDLADNGSIDNPIPDALLRWPAKGNPFFENIFSFSLPDTPQGLAPFVDQDNDGLYDPSKGDHPQIKGANQAIWWIFNDSGNIDTQSNGDNLQMEVHAMAYTYEGAPAPMNRATFYDYKFVNRAIENLDSAFVGIWVDPDLGCYRDDFIGSVPERNLFYTYNADAVDDAAGCGSCNGVPGFCEVIPIVSLQILKGTHRINQSTNEVIDNGMSSLIYYDNGSLSPFPATTDPTAALEFYNFLNGHWRDGTPMTVGGNGYDPLSNNYTKYAFPAAPNDTLGWSMCTANLGEGDRRALLGSGPFQAQPGGVNSLSFVVFITDDVLHPCPDISRVLEDSDDILDFFNDLPTGITTPASPELGIQLYPNPMADFSLLTLANDQIQQVELFATNGQLLRSYEGLNTNELKIERKDLASGMYFYRLQTTEGKSYSGKMIVE